jgi:hypothetical protein
LVRDSWFVVRGERVGVRPPVVLVRGSWFVVRGAWFVVLGSWFVVRGSWFVVRGAWCVVPGSWFLVPGAWFVVRGERAGVSPPVILVRGSLEFTLSRVRRGMVLKHSGHRGHGGHWQKDDGIFVCRSYQERRTKHYERVCGSFLFVSFVQFVVNRRQKLTGKLGTGK